MRLVELKYCKTADDFAKFTQERMLAANSHGSMSMVQNDLAVINNAMLLILLRQMEKLRGHVDE